MLCTKESKLYFELDSSVITMQDKARVFVTKLNKKLIIECRMCFYAITASSILVDGVIFKVL